VDAGSQESARYRSALLGCMMQARWAWIKVRCEGRSWSSIEAIERLLIVESERASWSATAFSRTICLELTTPSSNHERLLNYHIVPAW